MLPYTVEALQPLGGLVHGLDLLPKPSPDTLAMLDHELARRGVLIFANISLPGTLLSTVSEYFGSGQVVARHAVHDSAVHENILRVSNDPRQGIVGVGPQWHSDGFFERQIFSHVLFHAQRMPSTGGGGTSFADLAAAYDALPPRVQDAWSHLATVNAYSGAVHPLVIRHPRTGRRQLFIHLGMVGAVLDGQLDLVMRTRFPTRAPKPFEVVKSISDGSKRWMSELLPRARVVMSCSPRLRCEHCCEPSTRCSRGLRTASRGRTALATRTLVVRE